MVATLGEDMPVLERFTLLKAVNDRWQEHLQMVEYVREGIGLRGYGQVDPLVAYKRETYELFQQTLKNIQVDAAKLVFRLNITRPDAGAVELALDAPVVAEGGGSESAPAVKSEPGALPWPTGVDPKRVGRNDPCPCGSGLKFKECHYKPLRAAGLI
jgi:preprotein translocase subunit SecA